MNYLELSKVELHCHLDGSLRHDTIVEMANEMGIDTQGRTFHVNQCKNLDEYLEKFDIPIHVLQTKENLYRAIYELFEDASNEHVKYLEVRFGPLLHTHKGLSVDEVLMSLIEGMRAAEKQFDIHGNLILSFLRTMPKDQMINVLNAGAKYLNNGIVAVDLAASELKGFCHDFIDEIAYARELGYHVTIHAGETGYIENIVDAVELLKAERIGHGVALHKDSYQSTILNKGIHIEVCPTSNVQTKAVLSLSKHPIRNFLDLSLSINTDNRQVSNTNMTQEIEKVFNMFHLNYNDYKKIYFSSINASFASDEIKKILRDYMID